MSASERLGEVDAWLRPRCTRAGRVVFGDRRGLLVFLVAVAAAMCMWRTVFSINDNYTVANGLVAVSQGRLYVVEATFGETLASPGMVRSNGRAIPRNFAHVFLALPALWLLQLVSVVADLRLAFSGAWSLLLLGIVLVVGSLTDRPREARVAGSALALVAFAVNAWFATPLVVAHLAFLALQLTTVVVAGACAVLVYRLLARIHDSRTGLAAGMAVALASPGLLWASIPKRHALTAGFALLALWLLVASRDADAATRTRRLRALAYVPVGLTAWLNAAEGIALLFALATVDLLTAPENDLRTFATVGAAFALSLVPLVATNVFVSGDPFTVPRMLPPYDSETGGVRFVDDGSGGSGEGGGSGGSGGDGGSGGSGGGGGSGSSGGISLDSLPLVGSFLDVTARGLVFVSFLSKGVAASIGEPSKLYHTFVRSGYVGTDGAGATGLAINVAFLEALPVAGALVAAPVVAARRLSRSGRLARLRTHLATPAGTADAFVVAYTLVLTLLYIPRFPLHAMITVRYVYPLFPLAIYAVARLPATRSVVHERGPTLAFTYAAGVLVGSQLTLATVVVTDYAVDEAIQGYALLGLFVAALLAGWAVASALDHRDDRAGAVLFGVAGALATNLLGLVAYYYYGTAFLLPLVPG